MPTRPPLTVVDPNLSLPIPPRSSGGMASDCGENVQAEYSIEDPGGLELLAQACAGIDRAEALAERINADGEVIVVRGVPKPHPCLREELSARSFVCRYARKAGAELGSG